MNVWEEAQPECRCTPIPVIVEQREGTTPRWDMTLNPEWCPVHKGGRMFTSDDLKKYCSCEYSLIREGTTLSEFDDVIEGEDGRNWKRVTESDLCKLHSCDPKFDLPEGVM